MQEIWKSIKGFESLYEVSNLGNVKSLERFSEFGRHNGFKIRERILKPGIDYDGYLLVGLFKNKKAKREKVHRIVASHFIPNPENKPQVNHKNGIKSDNRVENLEWVTYSENNIHSYRELGRKSSFCGVSGKLHRLSICINQYSIDGVLLNTFESQTEAAIKTKTSRNTIRKSCNNDGMIIGKYILKISKLSRKGKNICNL